MVEVQAQLHEHPILMSDDVSQAVEARVGADPAGVRQAPEQAGASAQGVQGVQGVEAVPAARPAAAGAGAGDSAAVDAHVDVPMDAAPAGAAPVGAAAAGAPGPAAAPDPAATPPPGAGAVADGAANEPPAPADAEQQAAAERTAAAAGGAAVVDAVFVTSRERLAGGVDAALLGAMRAVQALIAPAHGRDHPADEFGSNRRLLAGAFPHLFPLGMVSTREGSLTPEVVRHMLLQFTNVHANDEQFLFLAFDQQQRHAAARAVSARVRDHAHIIERFGDLMRNGAVVAQVDNAVRPILPTGTEQEAQTKRDAQRAVLRLVMPFLLVSGSRVPFSPLATSANLAQAYAIVQTHGPFNVFITVSLDDVYSPLSLRLSEP
ncbi:hypothetical protein EON68_03815, partial [archaeon]